MDSGNSSSPASKLLAQVQDFDQSKLNNTETTITSVDGKTMIEKHEQQGCYKITKTEKSAHGFVPDSKLDLQVGEILPGLIQASQDVAAEWDILEKYKVTHILNIANYVRNYFPDQIKYLNLMINDTINFHIVPFFKQAFDFIDEARSGGGCVLVHCNAGKSRAATISIAYLMKTERITFDDALVYVKSKRPSSWPNSGFQFQLRAFEKSLGLSKS